jgi:flagellar motor protein MotB
MNLGGSFSQQLSELEEKIANRETKQHNMELLKSELRGESEVVKEESEVRMIIPMEILFRPGETKVAKPAEGKLHKILNTLRPYIGSGVVLEVAGHTDSSRASPQQSNFVLSSLRAGAVAEHAISVGVPRTSIRVSGLADLEPLLAEHGLSGEALRIARAKNRRVELRVRFPK